MGELIATITRRVSSLSQAPYFARTATGVEIGNFKTVPLAKSAVQRMVGGRPLRWATDVLAGGVESIRANGTEYTPLDTEPLVTWIDANQGVKLYPATTQAQLVGDYSQTGHPVSQSTLVNMPALSAGGPGGLDELLFWPAGIDTWMENDLELTPPYTISAVLNPSAVPAGVEVALAVHDGIADLLTFQVRPGALPRWAVENGAVILGPVTGGTPAVVTLVQRTSSASLYVGSTLVGANALAPTAGTRVRIGAPAFAGGIRWAGAISSVCIWGRDLFGTDLNNAISYAQGRFSL